MSHIILLRPIGLCSLIQMKAMALECTLCVRLGSWDGGAVWIEHTAAVFPSQTPALDHSCSVVPLTAIYLSLCAEKPIGPHASQKSCIQTLFAACRLFLLQQTYSKRALFAYWLKRRSGKANPNVLHVVQHCGFHHGDYDFNGIIRQT